MQLKFKRADRLFIGLLGYGGTYLTRAVDFKPPDCAYIPLLIRLSLRRIHYLNECTDGDSSRKAMKMKVPSGLGNSYHG